MTVYVDDMFRHPIGQFGRMKMSHLFADTDDELHEMAGRIGVARRWHQRPAAVGGPGMNASWSHYDISITKRALAVAAGAVEVKYGRELVEITRQIEERRRMSTPRQYQFPIDQAGDIEIWSNLFLVTLSPLDITDPTMWTYEVSQRRDMSADLFGALTGGYIRRFVGFNSAGYDWTILHEFMEWFRRGAVGGWQGCCTHLRAKNDAMFAAGDRWSQRVKPWHVSIPQVDLYMVHHFDNPARATSLKVLQFNMRSRSIEDCPLPFDEPVPVERIDEAIGYNQHDVGETKQFAHESRDMIQFRETLIAESGGKIKDDALCWNDTKIGKQHFIRVLEERQPGICYNADRSPRQTWRSSLALSEVILPYIYFDRPELRDLLAHLKAATLKTGTNGQLETKGVLDASVILDGFRFDLGTGGIHGSLDRAVIMAKPNEPLVDLDVTSLYPSIAIVNRFAPAHLGELFCDVYAELKAERVAAKRAKQMVKSDALKLALNGVYGDSNNIYSPFYDPKYTMSITVNGQLLLLMLAEKLMTVPTLRLVQINTDGVTFTVARFMLEAVEAVKDWWQWFTALELEEAQYGAMYIRDVNNYVATDTDGKVKKLKGAYDYELKIGDQRAWHKDPSELVVPRAAVAAMTTGVDPRAFIAEHLDRDPWDFMIRGRCRKGDRLELDDGTVLPQTIRYYISTTGRKLVKKMPPLKGNTGERCNGIHAEGQAVALGNRKGGYYCSVCGPLGKIFKRKLDFDEHNAADHSWKVRVMNRYDGEKLPDVDLEYYFQETQKLMLT